MTSPRSVGRALARAFAVVGLAVAKDLHDRGEDIGGVLQQHALNEAERAMFEWQVVTGAPVPVVRGADGWCVVIELPGKYQVSACDFARVGGRAEKTRPTTCKRCRAFFGEPAPEALGDAEAA